MRASTLATTAAAAAATAVAGSVATDPSSSWYRRLRKPAWQPPPSIFPVVWTALYADLAGFATGGPLYLDAPENNPEAMALVQRHGMSEVFGCARMYLGPFPAVAQERVFGVTTFELG